MWFPLMNLVTFSVFFLRVSLDCNGLIFNIRAECNGNIFASRLSTLQKKNSSYFDCHEKTSKSVKIGIISKFYIVRDWDFQKKLKIGQNFSFFFQNKLDTKLDRN